MSSQIQNQYKPDKVTSPGVTLLSVLDAQGMAQAELAERIGKTTKTIVEIIKHGAPITPETAIELEKALGVPASFWNNRERRFRESLARLAVRKKLARQVNWLSKLPLNEMIKLNWVPKCKDKVEQLNEALIFFGVTSPQQWEALWLSPRVAFRNSQVFKNKPEAISAWLRAGELSSRTIQCKPYNQVKFKESLQILRSLTRAEPEQFQNEAVQRCAEAGVAVVFVPPLKGSKAYGVTRWLTPKTALMQFSLRGKFEDILWFTFFHEAGHILKHGKKEIFIEGEEGYSKREEEADRFAKNFLIPANIYNRFVHSGAYRSTAGVEAFAKEIDTSPAVVVGRLQHDKLLPHTHLNRLRRRFDFA